MVHWSVDCIKFMMNEYEIDPKQVPNELQYQEVRGFGYFKCGKCKNNWMSAYMWLTFDLHKQKIAVRFKQKCNMCDLAVRPFFGASSLEDMLDYVCQRYISLVNDDVPGNGRRGGRRRGGKKGKKPHRSDLCAKCGYGTRKCWVRDTEQQ